jgi:hypothetical protein
MNEYNKYNAACPDDFELMAYKEGVLPVDDKQLITEHLLLCSDCLMQLELLPWNTVEEMKAAMAKDYAEEEETEISPIIKQAFNIYRKKQSVPPRENLQSLDEVLNKDGLEVGQMWRTKLEEITVPTPEGEEKYSVSKLGSVPHLVVITNTSVENQQLLSKNYPVIKVIPVDDNFQYARDTDIVFSEVENPLGYPFMLACWNQQEMLLENLDRCLGKLETSPVSAKDLPAINGPGILNFLTEKGREAISNSSFSLFGIIEKGAYADPAMRHRAREFENTVYLRAPVRELRESLYKVRESQKAQTSYAEKRGLFEIIQGIPGDLSKKLGFRLGIDLGFQPSFKSDSRLTAESDLKCIQTEDKLCEVAVYVEDGQIFIQVSAKFLELANREIILTITGKEANDSLQRRAKLKAFDENWVSAKFQFSREQCDSLLADPWLQIELAE